MIRRILALFACAVALAACRVDIAVDVVVEQDGTGSIAVVATADADVVAVVPSIADDLALDDVLSAGWAVEGPTTTDDGGLTIALSHDFASVAEASNLLNSLGPPFNEMAIQRSTTDNETTIKLSGLLGLSNGFASFADEDLVSTVGSLPFAQEITDSGETPDSSMSAVIRATIPGEIVPESTTGTLLDDGTLEWTIPLDGTIIEWKAVSKEIPGNESWWARPLSIGALVLLVAWVAFMVIFIGYVASARYRRARGYKRRDGRPPPVIEV